MEMFNGKRDNGSYKPNLDRIDLIRNLRDPLGDADKKEKARKMLRMEVLDLLKEYIGYKNEIPEEEIVPGIPDFVIYKCRYSVFLTVSRKIEDLAKFKAITDKNLIEEAENFEKYVTKKMYNYKNENGERRTKQEDIEYLNKIMNIFIKHLSKT